MTDQQHFPAVPTERSKAPLSAVATGRNESFFSHDLELSRSRLKEMIGDRRILAIGAAGTIGASTVSTLIDFRPAALHVVDQNENELAELVRRLRSRPDGLADVALHTLPLDFGSPIMRAWLHEQPAYDIVLNFAAIKHVRSEKDAFSTLHMFDTNLRKQVRLIGWLKEVGFSGRFFSVSTDKAANATSLMGASKRAMEHVMFDDSVAGGLQAVITSARFANVAFSNGSLLQSFERRLFRSEPLAAPKDTRRFFVSEREAGEICAIAALLSPHRTIVTPRLDPAVHLRLLEDVARDFLERHGYLAAVYSDEDAARRSVAEDKACGRWPLLLTTLDTSGEKPYEEFVAEGESVLDIGLPNLQGVSYKPAEDGAVAAMLAELEEMFLQLSEAGRCMPPTKDRLVALIGRVEPDFMTSHRETGRSLDARV